MAGGAVAKEASKRGTSLECIVIGVRSAFEPRHAQFTYPSSSLWTVDGPLGSRALTPRVAVLSPRPKRPKSLAVDCTQRDHLSHWLAFSRDVSFNRMR